MRGGVPLAGGPSELLVRSHDLFSAVRVIPGLSTEKYTSIMIVFLSFCSVGRNRWPGFLPGVKGFSETRGRTDDIVLAVSPSQVLLSYTYPPIPLGNRGMSLWRSGKPGRKTLFL